MSAVPNASHWYQIEIECVAVCIRHYQELARIRFRRRQPPRWRCQNGRSFRSSLRTFDYANYCRWNRGLTWRAMTSCGLRRSQDGRARSWSTPNSTTKDTKSTKEVTDRNSRTQAALNPSVSSFVFFVVALPPFQPPVRTVARDCRATGGRSTARATESARHGCATVWDWSRSRQVVNADRPERIVSIDSGLPSGTGDIEQAVFRGVRLRIECQPDHVASPFLGRCRRCPRLRCWKAFGLDRKPDPFRRWQLGDSSWK